MAWFLLKFVWPRRHSMLFSTLMFMFTPVAAAIMTRNERYCNRLRNGMSCWSNTAFP